MSKAKKRSTANKQKITSMLKRMVLNAPKKKKKRAARGRGRITGASMGPVASISTAPVAIGNSVRGARSFASRTPGGVTVTGRDFMFTPVGSGSITTWCMVGGTPLTPVAFGDSNVRQYMQMYQKYRWRKCVVHYITSSATSTTGDVMFYHGKNRDSVFLNQTSSFLLPFVISDPDTVIGPQWTNHSADLEVQSIWKSTDYGMSDSPNDYADGEVFLLSKTASTDSPGYVLFDYVIEFAEMQISPRLLNLPLPRAQFYQLALDTTGAKTQGNPATFVVGGNNISGSASALPTNYAIGDIYKVIIDNTNSTYTTGTAADLLQINNAGTGNAITITDGMTLYAQAPSATTLVLYGNCPEAYASASPVQFGASLTFSVNLQVWISLVGSSSSINLFPDF